jgi:hypothetical protein
LLIVKGKSQAFEIFDGKLDKGAWKYQLKKADGTLYEKGMWVAQHKLEYG